MKTLLICVLSLCSYIITAQTPANAGKNKILTERIIPPPAVSDKFLKEHPGLTPGWQMDGKNFRAEFVDPNTFKGINIVYDPEGNVIRRESELDNAAYPAVINDYFIKNYPGEKYKTWSSLDQTGAKTYYIRRSNDLVWFDRDGKVIEAQK